MTRSIYGKFVAVTLAVMFISSFLGFLFANIYYQWKLKPINDAKVTQVTERVTDFYQKNEELNLASYLEQVGDMGYQLLLTDGKAEERYFGGDFRVKKLDPSIIKQVLDGKTYHGIDQFDGGLFVTGFFDNQLKNSIGVPIETKDGTKALFVRPDQEAQFGELRFFFALILVLTAFISIVLVFISTRMVAKPIRKLTKATEKIAAGDFDVKLDTKRKDEIGQLGASFTKMTDELAAVDAARQEFVANVSHELQSPLTSMHGFAELLAQDKLTEEERKSYLALLSQETARLSRLTKQLLLLAFLDKETEMVGQETVDPAPAIRKAIRMFEWKIQEKELSLTMDLSDAKVQGDAELIEQVWQNLLSNAVKYTPEHGSIEISSKEQGDWVEIRVWNSGEPIPDEKLGKVFERFYRGDESRLRSGESSGLGLSIVEKIIQLSNGSIAVRSEAGLGTEFIVRLKKANL
ncbi:sensor histidine kinase [Listeria aquatica]|uniref:sensor histidine kinase n=1 Tax=Listeria aquatica TaxID=1494960 RepID=UPI003EF105F8